MTDNFLIKINNGLGFLRPYINKVFSALAVCFSFVGTAVRKSEKKAKMHIRLIRLKNILEIVSNVALIIASVIAVICAIVEFLRRDN